MEHEFDYAFWCLNPYVLNKGEECFVNLAKYFGIDDNTGPLTLTNIENEIKDDILYALVKAYNKGDNPFNSCKLFALENLINSYKIDRLIDYICETQGLNRKDFEHDVYNDGALLEVKYKGEVIA